MKRRWQAGVIVVGLVLVGTVGMVSLRSDRVNRRLIPPAPTSVPSNPPSALTDAELAFYSQVAPPMRVAAAESERLAQLGEAHSRNVFELQTRSGRLTSAMDGVDRALQSAETPERFAAAIALYRQAETDVDETVATAKQAFASFDFPALGDAVTGFRSGAELLASASAELDMAAGLATPASQATP